MDLISQIIAIILGIFAIVSGLYKFYTWRKARTEAKAARPNSKTAQLFIIPQQRALERWRLFDFHRDIKMADIYVQEIFQAQAKQSPVGLPSPNESKPIPERDVLGWVSGDIGRDDQICTIVGQAGSGKSTMLRSWTLKLLAEHKMPITEQAPPVPLYLSLRHLSASAGEGLDGEITSNDLARCLSRTIPALDEETGRQPFSRLQTIRTEDFALRSDSILHRLLRKKTVRRPEWIFMCDGLDEMAPEIRPKLFHWIQGLPRSVRVVLSTRPGIISQIGHLPRSIMYEICDFNSGQIRIFATQWFNNNKPLGDILVEQIESNESLGRLAVIPLLLTCLSMDVEVSQNAIFPKDLLQSDILRRVLEIMLDKWDAIKEGRPIDQKRIQLGMSVFSELAIEHSYGSNFPYAELVAKVQKYANEFGVGKESADEFTNRITTAARLLIGTPEFGFSFNHATFFDFFFAEGVNRLLEEHK